MDDALERLNSFSHENFGTVLDQSDSEEQEEDLSGFDGHVCLDRTCENIDSELTTKFNEGLLFP